MVAMPTGVRCGYQCRPGSSPPTAGASQPAIHAFIATPATTLGMASSTRGTIITAGDSWGWTPSCHLFCPKNVISISRVM